MSVEKIVDAKPWSGFDCTEMLDFSATADHNLMNDSLHIEFHEHYMNSCSDIEVVDNESSFISEKVQLVEMYPNLGVKVETISENLSIPWSIDFANDGRIFFSERTGTLQVIDGDVQKQILDLNVGGGEGGMLGIALDPDFESNHYIYIYYTYN